MSDAGFDEAAGEAGHRSGCWWRNSRVRFVDGELAVGQEDLRSVGCQ